MDDLELDDAGLDSSDSDFGGVLGGGETAVLSPRDAFAEKDAGASRAAHVARAGNIAPEAHKTEQGQYIKSVLFGGLDGIITTFAIVAGIAGAGLSTGMIIVVGLSNLIADGISMGMGDFLSTRAEMSYLRSERARESWECDNYMEGEKREMVEIYQERGLSLDEATEVIDIMSKYRELFLDVMMVEELGLLPDDSEVPWKNGLVTFVSFLVFGSVPLIVYIVAAAIPGVPPLATFFVALFATCFTLFGLGALKSKFTAQRWYFSGLIVLSYGGAAAGLAYGIGFVMSALIG